MKKTSISPLLRSHGRALVLLVAGVLCALPGAAQPSKGIEGCYGMPGCSGYRPGTPSKNPPKNAPASNTRQQQHQQMQNAIGAIGAISASMERTAREQAEREQREEAENARRQQAEQQRQQQVQQQMQSAAARAEQDPVLNPFGNAPSGGAPAGGAGTSGTPGAPAAPAAPAVNLGADYTGQACRWFVVRDEESCSSRSCYYSEGQTVAIGRRAYRCDSGRWALIRDCNQAPLEHQKAACQTDIAKAHGAPGSKETPAAKIYRQD